MNEPFCDFVQVTVPVENWPEVRAAVEPVFSMAIEGVQVDDASTTLWRGLNGEGTVKAKRYGAVVALGMSGHVCASMRAFGLFAAYLAELASRPHRVTRLDASFDLPCDAAPVIADVVNRVASPSGLKLTRKAIAARDVTRLVHRRDDGADTGTVYVGSRDADVRACVYDKREERLRRGLADVGPLTRYELRLKAGTGVTLRDAAMPAAVFWHYASPGLLSAPEGVEPWEAHGEGFPLSPQPVQLPAARLLRRVQASVEVRSLLDLAATCGPYGVELLLSEVRKLSGCRGGAPTVTPSDGPAPAPPEPPAASLAASQPAGHC